jgi:hypothetical protein
MLIRDKAVYVRDGRHNTTFLNCTQRVLQNVAAVGPELMDLFPIPEDGSVKGISRVSGHMNLLYHQV